MPDLQVHKLTPLRFMPRDVWTGPEPAAPKPTVLCISGNPEDYKGLRRMVDRNLWHVISANTRQIGIRRLPKGVHVVFCECTLPDGTWKDILNCIVAMESPPQLVVMSRLADAYLWSEVLNLGGFDVLAKPLVEKEVRQVLEAVARNHLRTERRIQTAGVI
jgi:DNA-binding response OmpR family regulator